MSHHPVSKLKKHLHNAIPDQYHSSRRLTDNRSRPYSEWKPSRRPLFWLSHGVQYALKFFERLSRRLRTAARKPLHKPRNKVTEQIVFITCNCESRKFLIRHFAGKIV